MNKNIKALTYIAGFVLLILAAVFGYNYLTDRYKAPNSLGLPSETSSKTPADDTQSPAPSVSGEEQGDKKPQEEDGPQEEQRPQAKEPIKALDFTVQDYDGNEVKLSDYIGTPIVLNFWASWCPPCRAEMPHFNKVSEEYPKDKLIFLMVDMVDGGRETIDKGKKHVEDNGYTFPVLFDTKQNAAATYGIRALPTTFFIDEDAYIVTGAEGGIDEETLRYGVSLILDE
jgi:cytochrome c biogenesis protein CcmG/thiol:disulfide interchange protein DsbE